MPIMILVRLSLMRAYHVASKPNDAYLAMDLVQYIYMHMHTDLHFIELTIS